MRNNSLISPCVVSLHLDDDKLHFRCFYLPTCLDIIKNCDVPTSLLLALLGNKIISAK